MELDVTGALEFAVELETEGSEGSEDFVDLSSSLSSLVVILFELFSEICSNISGVLF